MMITTNATASRARYAAEYYFFVTRLHAVVSKAPHPTLCLVEALEDSMQTQHSWLQGDTNPSHLLADILGLAHCGLSPLRPMALAEKFTLLGALTTFIAWVSCHFY